MDKHDYYYYYYYYYSIHHLVIPSSSVHHPTITTRLNSISLISHRLRFARSRSTRLASARLGSTTLAHLACLGSPRLDSLVRYRRGAEVDTIAENLGAARSGHPLIFTDGLPVAPARHSLRPWFF